jgi:hypothetical protein
MVFLREVGWVLKEFLDAIHGLDTVTIQLFDLLNYLLGFKKEDGLNVVVNIINIGSALTIVSKPPK